jgi:hypothetical protein
MTSSPPSPRAEPGADATAARLDLDVELIPEQTADDTDAGWGTEARGDADPATVLRRYLDDTPPHHGD